MDKLPEGLVLSPELLGLSEIEVISVKLIGEYRAAPPKCIVKNQPVILLQNMSFHGFYDTHFEFSYL